jgi:hypothetical protein
VRFTFEKNKMADMLSLGGFGLHNQICNFSVLILVLLELEIQTKLFYYTITPSHMPIWSQRQNCTAINLKALNMAEGHVQRFRALRATTKLV